MLCDCFAVMYGWLSSGVLCSVVGVGVIKLMESILGPSEAWKREMDVALGRK